VNVASSWNYGSIHSHDEIAKLMHLDKNSNRYKSMISRANQKLTGFGKRLENIKGEGYKVVEPDRYTDISLNKFQQGVKRIRDSYSISEHAPIDKMTEEGRKRFRSYNERLSIMRAITEGHCKELTVLSKPIALSK
jgi:hypothetical protein